MVGLPVRGVAAQAENVGFLGPRVMTRHNMSRLLGLNRAIWPCLRKRLVCDLSYGKIK